MRLPRRKFLHLATGAAALPAVARIARAQPYPTQPVRVIVPFAPAGSGDMLARLIGQWLSERLGQPFVIENRPGAAGNIGTEAAVRAPADGYTLLLVGGWNAINATLYDKLSFNFIRDIAPVAGISREPYVIVVHPSIPAKTVPEFIAYANANPGKVNMASAGNGSPSHVSGELFKTMAGVNMVHVPYRGGGPAITDLLGGQVQVMFAPMAVSIEYIRVGKLRPLAVTTAIRSNVLPNIPTVGDFMPDYEASNWYGFGVPKNAPAEVVNKLNNEINAASPIPRSRRGWPTLEAHRLSARPLPSASSSPTKPKSGARLSSSPVPSRADPDSPRYSVTPDIRTTLPMSHMGQKRRELMSSVADHQEFWIKGADRANWNADRGR